MCRISQRKYLIISFSLYKEVNARSNSKDTRFNYNIAQVQASPQNIILLLITNKAAPKSEIMILSIYPF